jgi:hypothetical protein
MKRGVRRAFLPNPSGREARGKAWHDLLCALKVTQLPHQEKLWGLFFGQLYCLEAIISF